MTYLDITNTLGQRGSNQHGCRGDKVCGEENGAEVAFRKVELALEEVGHP